MLCSPSSRTTPAPLRAGMSYHRAPHPLPDRLPSQALPDLEVLVPARSALAVPTVSPMDRRSNSHDLRAFRVSPRVAWAVPTLARFILHRVCRTTRVTTPLAGCLPSWRFYLMTSNFRLNHRGFRGYRFPFGFSRSLPTALRHLWSPYLMACRSSEARVFAVTSPLVEIGRAHV